MKCESIDVIDREFNWDLEKNSKTGSWNGKMVQALAADLSMQNVYHSVAVTAANVTTNSSAHIYLIEGNDSYNPPSSSAEGDRDCNSSNQFYYQGGTSADTKGNKAAHAELGYSKVESNSDGSGSKFSAGVGGNVDNKGNASGEVFVRQEWNW